jgi:hypothetical protein
MIRCAELRLSILSARTAKYVEARVREGDNFDYRRWLRQVRGEEDQANQVPTVYSSGESVASELADLTATPDRLDARKKSEAVLPAKSTLSPRAVYGSGQKAGRKSAQDRLRRRLIRVSDAFDEFQESRARDAVYKYLAAVFAVVVDHKGRRLTKRLLRRAFKFAGRSHDRNADPFATVIRCTCERNVDNKTISKWARSLRYVAYCKVPRTKLRTFMKRMGGINGCADRHSRYLGRGTR